MTALLFVASFGLVGCRFRRIRSLPTVGEVTRITVAESHGPNTSSKITDPVAISQIVAFVDSHGSGWYRPWYGIPTPDVSIDFYDGDQLEGGFGVGKYFLETQRDGGFYSQQASAAAVNTFLGLVLDKPDLQTMKAGNVHHLNGTFKIITTTNLLPAQIKSAFAGLIHDSRFEMADPGQEFQLTDVITEEGLPSRRLVFGGLSERECFMHYERGGYSHSYYVVVFSTAPSNTRFLWGEALCNPAKDLPELRSEVSATIGPSDGLTF